MRDILSSSSANRNNNDDAAAPTAIVIEEDIGNGVSVVVTENGDYRVTSTIDNDDDNNNNTSHDVHHIIQQQQQQQQHLHYGSSIKGTIFNFTNCIVGAGAIGLGGAFAESGGLISVTCIVFFACLTKLSLDLVMQLSLEQQQQQAQQQGGAGTSHHLCSYEDLGRIAFGCTGYMTVLTSKFLYAYGCLVAYIVVVKDNFGPAVKSLLYGKEDDDSAPPSSSIIFFGDTDTDSNSNSNWLYQLLSDDVLVTWIMSFSVILPLCLLRDMTPLSNLSAVGIFSVVSIVGIIGYLYVVNPQSQIREHGGSTYENWVEIRWLGFLQSLGTFVFSFVSQHTVHLAFHSLKPNLQTLSNWKRVSSWSLSIAGTISLLVGIFAYMTFWESTRSDLFELYPPIPIIDTAKLLLCIVMLLTFPLPFFTCRELLIDLFCTTGGGGGCSACCAGGTSSTRRGRGGGEDEDDEVLANEMIRGQEEAIYFGALSPGALSLGDLREPLLPVDYNETSTTDRNNGRIGSVDVEEEEDDDSTAAVNNCCSILLPDDDRQLKLPFHVVLTVMIWVTVTWLAIAAPSLGDVLDLVGCASGTIIAFIFPGLLSFRLQQGYSCTAITIFVVGGAVGIVGTYFSTQKLIEDINQEP